MSFFTRMKKTVKRGAQAATKAAGKRYKVSYGRKGLKVAPSTVTKLAKDILMIKNKLNTEKKTVKGLVQLGSVAQADLNTFGFVVHDLTPIIAQGLGEENRVGNSLKMTNLKLKIQLRGEGNCNSARRLKLMLIKTTRPTTVPLINIIEDMFDINPLTGFVDYHSNRDYSDNQRTEKTVRTQSMYLAPPVAISNDAKQLAIKDYTLSVKLNDIWRYESNLVSAPNDCRYFICIMADTGNRNVLFSSNPGVMVQINQSGVEYQFHNEWHYVDN